MAPRRKLEVRVVMCCQGCVDKVEEVLRETHGVLEFKIERYNSLVIVTENHSGGPNHKQLVRKLKRATHDKTAEILRETETETPSSSNVTTPTFVYFGYPNIGPGYHPVPWPPTITNPNYFHHPIRCHYCAGYSDIVCANCGRSSNF